MVLIGKKNNKLVRIVKVTKNNILVDDKWNVSKLDNSDATFSDLMELFPEVKWYSKPLRGGIA